MPAPQGLFHFDGIESIISGSFTFSHGIAPSVAMVQIPPQFGPIATNGTLTLTFGTGFKLQFPGCRVKAPTIQTGIDGRIMSFGIEDRRWKWEYGSVFGRYNIKRADGTIDTLRSQEKTPQELATILLKAMNEQGYDVSPLPNKLRPTMVWYGVNPARELAQLCDDLGCRVVLGLDNRVRLVVLGKGRDLPANPQRRTTGYGLQITGVPDRIKVVCGPSLYQSKLWLEAVGLDNDGRVKPIDDLSYKPSGGWSSSHPDGFYAISNLADRRLALQTVYRWYRIYSQADVTFKPPGSSTEINRIEQMLPIRSGLLQQRLNTKKDPNDLRTLKKIPAYVEGAFLKRNYTFGSSLNFTDIQKGATTDSNGNTYIGARYVGGFSIDEDRGIVEFNDWVAKQKTGGGLIPAELYLTCSYSVVDDKQIPDYHSATRHLGKTPTGAGDRIIHAPDIQLQHIAEYGPDGKKVKKVSNNRKEVDRWTTELLDQAMKEYQTPETEEVEYAGFHRIDLDGRRHQVGWEFGSSGAITRASSNSEFDPIVPKFSELREQQKIRAIQDYDASEPVVTGAS